jgi:hypothetical protein
MREMTVAGRVLARRALAVAGLMSLAGGLLLLPAAAHSAAQVTGTAAHVARASTVPVTHSVTKVTGPHLWDPATSSQFKDPSQVTVSQTSNLVDQLIHVTWSVFTPSINVAAGPYYVNTSAYYAVMAVECRGTNPTTWTDCYESSEHGLPLASDTSGPPNASYAVTSANGTGQLSILIETSLENSVLGCDQNHPCSLVILPGQGGQPGDCGNHQGDQGFGESGTALAFNTFFADTGGCSWNDRITVPLHFAPVPTGCPLRNAAFSAEGSPMMAVAMQQWLPSLCAGRNGMTVSYSPTLAEPTAVQDAVSGATDVALTTQPASADGVTTGNKHYVYAPIAVSAASIAYWIDDNKPGQGQPLGGLKLNQRLLAKLLTQSYDPRLTCASGQQPPSCDNGVDHDPFDLFRDREFIKLDPGIAHNVDWTTDQTYIVPTVASGPSDLTWTVTRWIADSADATSYLTGTFDPWQEHVNTYYLGLKYPTTTFTAQDPNGAWAAEYSPVFPLSQAVTYQALNQDAGSFILAPPPQQGFTKDPPEPEGKRALIAVLDQGDAALNQMPTALIPNAAGNYVGPSSSSMAAALSTMVSNGSGTMQVNLASKNPDAYPLTMVIYAMVPTSGVPHAKAAAIARFLDFAAGPGQSPGALPGQLAAGYLPLPKSMREQTLKAASEVLHQTGDSTSGGGNGPGHSGQPSAPSGSQPTSSASPSPQPGSSGSSSSTTPPAVHQAVSLVSASTKPASITRYALPALLIFGALAALGGSSALAGTGEGGIAGRLRRLWQASTTRRGGSGR